MRTTEEILDDLHRRAAAGEDVRQQVISHETIARLRAELAGVDKADTERAAGLRAHIGVHERLVDEQPAEPTPEPTPEPAKPAKAKPAE